MLNIDLKTMINLDMKNIKMNKNSFVLRALIHTKKVIAT